MKKKMIPLLLTSAMLLPTLAACNSNKAKEPEGERTLRVATTMGYGDDGEYFRDQFTEIFEYANPNIKIEFVQTFEDKYRYGGRPKEGEKMPDPFEKLKESMQGANPPDVVMFDLSQMPQLLGENLLAPLDPLISKDKFDTADIVPAVIDGIKAASTDGKLYGLAPLFSSSALVYNKKMFDEAGVPYPTDGMTWDQMFDLARRVTKGEGEKKVYGFNFYSQSHGDLFSMSHAYTVPLKLRVWDEKGEKMLVDDDNWEKAWKTLIQLQNDKIAPNPEDMNNPEARMRFQGGEDNPFGYNDFMSGRLAMTLMHYGELNQIDNANKNAENFKNYTKVDYDVVTMPSHPENPGVVANIGINGLMGINAKAGNADDAWRFIKFINSEDWARSKAKNNYQLVSRKKYIKQREGINVQAFYNVKPMTENFQENYKIYQEKPNIYRVQDIGRQEFMQAAQGQKTVRDALKSWQTQGDALLQQMKDNPNAGGPEMMPAQSIGTAG